MNGKGVVQKQERYTGESSVIISNPGTELDVLPRPFRFFELCSLKAFHILPGKYLVV